MWRWEVFWSLGAHKEPYTAPLALGVPRRSASDHMVTPPSALWSLGVPQRTSYSPMCFLALGALVELLLSTCYSCVHVPSIPEFLNSGMLMGVDTAPYLWGVLSYYLYSGWGLHPQAFLNSGIQDSECASCPLVPSKNCFCHISCCACVCLLSLGALVELLLITCAPNVYYASWLLAPSYKCF